MKHPPVGNADHEILYGDGVAQRVERLALGPYPALSLQILVVFLLDMGGIGQHDRAEVPAGRGGVDRSVKAFLDQEREPPAVIDVGMAQDHGIDPAGVERELRVQTVALGPVTLEQAPVEQDPGTGGFEQVHRSGHLSGSAPEGEIEGCSWGATCPKQAVSGVSQPGKDVSHFIQLAVQRGSEDGTSG